MNLGTGSWRPERGAPVWCNVGGPMTRTRREPISAHLLGRTDGAIRCRRIVRIGLLFPEGADPVGEMTGLLAQEGFDAPEDLRAACQIPDGPLLATRARDPLARLDVASASADAVLEQALLLGLCTSQLYDPARPVLWTTASLGRALDLFEPLGFYA